MKLFRRILFWSHLGGGLLAAALILLMSVTGILLAYEKQMISWEDREFRLAEVPSGAQRLPLSVLAARVTAARGAMPSGFSAERDPLAPVAFQYGRKPNVYVNPYSGETLGVGGMRIRGFMEGAREWHRWLAVSGNGRSTARAITGAANLIFLFLVLSGIYLWLPKAFSWKYLRPIVWFWGGLRGKAREFNWHNAAGFWCAVPLVFVIFSAVFISYPAASKALIEWFDGVPAASASTTPPGAGHKGAERQNLASGLDAAWQQATVQMADWQTISMQFPKLQSQPLTISVGRGTGGQPQYRGTLTADAESGALLRWEPFESLSLGRRARLWMRFVHTGEYYGLPGQTIAGLASAGAALLAYSGLVLSLRRFLLWRVRRKRPGALAQPISKAA